MRKCVAGAVQFPKVQVPQGRNKPLLNHPLHSTIALSPLKRAYLAIEELQARLAAAETARSEPVAIIGLGCRFPGDADTPEDFWRLLAGGIDAVTEVPASRWPVEAFFDADPMVPGRMAARHGGFLRDIEGFDAAYFGISPREAAGMDPQHRLLLEVAWEALTAAGQRRERLAGSPTGVFVGITTAEYSQLRLGAEGLGSLDTYHITGNALNAAAGRIAFVFGLQGPCMAVDTACSSSLVALHLACQSLRAGECETALAGGVNLILSPIGSIALSKGRVLSADGRAKTFDAAADGMVRGEGCGLLVLKRLAAARRDGDRVLAVIRGSGINQDGPSSGLTVPNGPAQEQLLRQVLAAAQIDPAAVDYVEAHGTGTALGDPIEVGALGAVYGQGRSSDRALWIGSVKTNLGHLEAAAGIAGVIKTVLALQYEAIPPHLHFQNPSPHIDWKNLPFRVPTALVPWPRGERPRLAAVSAFGFCGTNAHVLLGEAPEPPAADDARGLVVPATPFHRERYPLPRPASYGGPVHAAGSHPLLGGELALAGTTERRFESNLAAAAPAWLGDHRIAGATVVPATALLEMAHAAARVAGGAPSVSIRDFSVRRALVLPEGSPRPIQTVAHPGSDGVVDVAIHGRWGDEWTLHATARAERAVAPLVADVTLPEARARCPRAGGVEALYAAYARRGLGYGPAFRAVQALWIGEGETVAEIHLPAAAGNAGAFGLHPVLLDACFQGAGAAFPETDEVFLPVSVAHWTVQETTGGPIWCHARVQAGEAGATIDLTLFAPDGRVVARLDGLALQRASQAALRRAVRTEDDWLYEVAWSEVPAPAEAGGSAAGAWLLAMDTGGVGLELAERLRAAGAEPVCVAPPQLAAALAQRPAWRGVVHLGALDVGADAPPDFAGLGFESVLALARSSADLRAVWIVTAAAVLAGGVRVRPAATARWGLGRTLAQEHPEWSLRLVDLESASAAAAAATLAAECLRPDGEDQIAWRAGRRHAARLVRFAARETSAPTLPAASTYLITGGLGALGRLAAGWLVERGARHLVLVGRHEPTPEARTRIEEWIAAGVRVETRSVDVADRAQVQALLETLPGLRGIVHAAGVIDDGAARQLAPEQFARVLAPKAAGAWHLHQLAGELDFFVLFSSAAAVLGTPGQANYAAANGFLDGLAHLRRAEGRPALSVNWGPWSVGLAAGLGDRYTARGVGAITPARGFEELERLLGTSTAQAAVLPVAWGRFLAALPPGRTPPLLVTLARAAHRPAAHEAPAADLSARLAGAAPAERAVLLADFLLAEIARVLRLAPEKLGRDQPLNTLGLDSIMAVDLRNRVRLATGVDLPLVHFLEGAAVATLAQELVRRFAAPAPTATAADELTPARAAELLARIDTLSDAEVEALLGAEGGGSPR